ncbi:MAG: c-type cytochrome [Pirellulales bacterium]|nr:c-type cytochrome [Pirellulales bacterium]
MQRQESRLLIAGLLLTFASFELKKAEADPPNAAAAAAAPAKPSQPIPYHQDRPPGPALSPEEAIARMTVPEGFRVECVAHEPDLVNPVAMTFDERGRVWVCESLEYPRREAGPGRDRVKVLDDTDADGRADRFTIFAEGLNIPSGIAVGHGGVWVANSPDLLFLQDTDGDGHADRREVVVTGFGRDDTHELPNSLTWGPDGWLYGLNGVFNRSRVEQDGRVYLFTCAVWRVEPRTRRFELFAEGTSNPWGIAFDPAGSMFLSACVIDHLWHITETGYYHRQGGAYPPHAWKLGSIVEHTHQKAAYCGIHYVDSDAYPAEYRDRLVMGNIHGGCLNVDVLERRGATYFARPASDFLTANDAWFMPVAQKTGPDGSLYVLDWYDRYHCYQDAGRDPAGIDRLRGRLYRVRYGDTPRAAPFDLARESDDKLIARLASGNFYFRDQAQRLLAERNSAAANARLVGLVFDGSASIKTRLHALWALAGTGARGGGALDAALCARLLQHSDSTLRAWGVRLAGNLASAGIELPSGLRACIAALATDDSPDVRLQVAIATPKCFSGSNGALPFDVLLEVLTDSGDDPLVPAIVWQNLYPLLQRNAQPALAALVARAKQGGRGLAPLVPRVVHWLSVSGEQFDVAGQLVLALVHDPSARPAAAECLEAIHQAIRHGELDEEEIGALRAQLGQQFSSLSVTTSHDRLSAAAIALALAWGDASARDSAIALAADVRAADAQRQSAIDALAAVDAEQLLSLVERLLADVEQNSLALRRGVLTTLGQSQRDNIARIVLAAYDRQEPELRPAAIELLTQRPAWAQALLAAVADNRLPREALNLAQVRRLARAADKQLAGQIHAIWGTVRTERNPAREQVLAQVRAALEANPGDPLAGRAVFEKSCAQCHKIYGAGHEVGPDITANGRNSWEQLLSNVLDPNLVIGAAYETHTLVTDDGRVLSGLLVEDSPERVVLKLQGAKLETIPRDEIDEMEKSPLSLMPEELEKQITPAELADLFAYLALDRPPDDPAARRLPGAPQPRNTD